MSVLAGLVVKSKPLGKAVRQPTAVDLHRFLALLGLGALGLHGVALVLDSTVKITPAALLVPGLAPYRPLWTAFGVLAAELMVLVYVSFALRRWIGARNWRRLHWATYAIFAAGDRPRPRRRHGLDAPLGDLALHRRGRRGRRRAPPGAC